MAIFKTCSGDNVNSLQKKKKLEEKIQYTLTIKRQGRPSTNYNLETDPTSYTEQCIYKTSDSNNINSQLDATITDFIDNYNQLSMFRAIISPILRSTRLPAGSIARALYRKQ